MNRTFFFHTARRPIQAHLSSIILLNAEVTNYFNLLSASLFLGAIRQFIKRVLFQNIIRLKVEPRIHFQIIPLSIHFTHSLSDHLHMKLQDQIITIIISGKRLEGVLSSSILFLDESFVFHFLPKSVRREVNDHRTSCPAN